MIFCPPSEGLVTCLWSRKDPRQLKEEQAEAGKWLLRCLRPSITKQVTQHSPDRTDRWGVALQVARMGQKQDSSPNSDSFWIYMIDVRIPSKITCFVFISLTISVTDLKILSDIYERNTGRFAFLKFILFLFLAVLPSRSLQSRLI